MDNPLNFSDGKGQLQDSPDSDDRLFHKFSSELQLDYDLLFQQVMSHSRVALCLSDPMQEDCPIIFVNAAFVELTGYSEDEIIGRNCRFLQGPDTDPEAVYQIRRALAAKEVAAIDILNYRKDGSSFWNALHIGPIYNAKGGVRYFFGTQWEKDTAPIGGEEEQLSRNLARELSHRIKNLFSVIGGIINVTGRVRNARSIADEINTRIQALGRAYEKTLDEASSGAIPLSDAIKAVLEPFDPAGTKLVCRGANVRVPFAIISIVGLILHELAIEARQYGAWSPASDPIEVYWTLAPDEKEIIIRWSHGKGPCSDPSNDLNNDLEIASSSSPQEETGSQMITQLLQSVKGKIERNWHGSRLNMVLNIPIEVEK